MENANRKKINEYLKIIIVDVAAAIIIGGSITLDYFFSDVIQGAIISVSLDSFICVVSVLVSILLPRSENESLRRYGVSPSDYRALKSTTNRSYINLLIVSILLFVGNMLFYAFELRLTLIVSFTIILFYIIFFLWDFIVDAMQGDNAIIKIVKKQLHAYYKKHNELNSLLSEENFSSGAIGSLNKLANAALLNSGFEACIKQLNTKKNQIDESILYDYMSKLQMKFIDNINDVKNTDYFINNESLDTTLNQYVSNIRDLCALAETYIHENDALEEYKQNLIKSFHELNSMVHLENVSNLVGKNFLDVINTLFSSLHTVESTLDTFQISLLTKLLIYTLADKKDSWAFNAIAYCVSSSDYSNINRNGYYMVYVLFLYDSICTTGRRNGLSVGNLDSLNDVTIRTFASYLKNIITCGSHMPFDDIYKNFQWFSTFSESPNSSNRSIPERQRRSYLVRNRYGERYFEYLTKLFIYCCAQDNFVADDILHSITCIPSSRVLSSMRHWRHNLDGPYYLPNNELMKKFLIENDEDEQIFGDENIARTMEFVRDFTNRERNLSRIKENVNLSLFADNLNKEIQSFAGYSETTPDDDKPGLMHYDYDGNIHFIVRSDQPILLTDDDTFCNPKHIISKLMDPKENFYFDAEQISEYTTEIGEKIAKFKPTLKHAPHFDDYNRINNNDVFIKKELGDKYFYLIPEEDKYEIFAKGKPIVFNASVSIDEKSAIRLLRPSDLSDKNVNSYLKSYNKAISNEKELYGEECTIEEINNHILSDYILINMKVLFKVTYYKSKTLVFALRDDVSSL